MKPIKTKKQSPQNLTKYLPSELTNLSNPQTAIPSIAKNKKLLQKIHSILKDIPTHHELICADSRIGGRLAPNSVHLIVTSPPYWTLKRYRDCDSQLGHIEGYNEFLKELDLVWKRCFDALVPGGRLVCVVGDVCLSRRKNKGRHTVVPLHASIQEHCRDIGFDNLAPIIWYKIANIAHEVKNGSSFLGKPYEPNSIIKNDIEFILMERKPGGYRKPQLSNRLFSIISEEDHKKWFQQIWSNIPGASTKNHPAPYPLELVERLIQMFSFAGDTVLDPFMGTGSTNLAAAKWGRDSIGIEIDEYYFDYSVNRLKQYAHELFNDTSLVAHKRV